MTYYLTFILILLQELTPNRVTLIGAFFLYLGVIILAFYDLTFTKILPDWLYFLFSVSIFLGQTFDAIDGKHARNTKRGSPLGQLMDHGCDAITNSCISIYIAQSFIMGTSISSLVMLQCVVHVIIRYNSLIN
jgi:phosphatidylglycerophosphate synthase